MTLTQITKIRGAGIHTTSNIVSHNINSSGIITATEFKGPFTGSSNIQSGILTATKIDLNGDIDVDGHTNLDNVNVAGVATFASAVNTGALTATTGTFSGNVSIGGTLTYEDVTNIDSVGLITARDGVNISDTTQSTSTTTGALKVAGGAGIVKNLNVGGTIHGTLLSSSQTSTGVILKLARTGTANGEYGFKLLNDAGTNCSLLLRDEKANEARLSISSAGKIGINNSTAKYALHFKNAMGSSPSWIHMEVTGSNAVGGGGGIAFDTSASNDASNNSIYLATIKGIRNTADNGSNDLVFSTSTNGITGDDGNAGTAKEKLRITSGGNVGIGTDNPGSLLTLDHATNPAIQFKDSGTKVASINAEGTQTNIASFESKDLVFATSASSAFTERLRITSDGQIGVNNTSPDAWHTQYTSLQIHDAAVLYGSQDDSFVGLGANHFLNTNGDFKYSNTDFASRFYQVNGGFHFESVASGTAGNTLTFTERLRINSSGHITIGTASAAGGRLYFESTSGAAQYIASGGTNNQDLIVGSSAGDKLRISSAGRVLIATTTEGHGNADDLTIATAGGTLGHTGITIRSGTSNDGNIFFSDATSGGGETIGGIKYTHGGAGSNAETLNFIANGLTRATVSATAFWVDDGTNARLKLAPDSATLNMIISTTTNNGSYCNLLYGAADHIFKYGGTETARLTTGGNYTITGEFASAQDYPVIKPTLDLNFVLNKTLDPRFEYYSYGPASYVDENGKVVFVTDGIPRFDHDPVTRECKGLLIEGERSNKIPHSFDNGNWSAGSGGATLTRNAGIAPDGTMTATKVLSANNDIDVNPQLGPASPGATGQIAISGSVTYTLSIWAKASTTAQIGNNFKVRWKRVQGNAAFAETTFALTGNWVRYSATTTTASNNSTIACYIGGVSGSEALVWGAQLESGTTSSSLIPTYGYTVTRGADVIEMQGEEFTDFYNQEEGTIFLSASYETDARSVANVTIDDTSNYSEYTEIGYRAGGASSGDASSYIRTDTGNDQYYKNWASSVTQGNEFKIALGYKDDNYASSANGSTVHTDTSGTTSRVYDRLRFSQVHTVGHGGVGHYRRLMYYSKRITNSQLVTLTS